MSSLEARFARSSMSDRNRKTLIGGTSSRSDCD
jgi:hypothetical protein